ncbi:MBL fold metallo-hydrolase [Undibacterium arcticum]|uniref:MBL fold metallo-hydrolase n=1 Tax=Undibacterium arcticum TaxID=1762892 RepID=A0ABV7F9P1_9BURK
MLFHGLLGIAMACCCMLGVAADLQLEPVRVAPGVYVVYGDLKPASYDNDALTVNLGFITTSAGVVVIDSGPSYRVAQMLHRAIQRVSSYPIKYVINTGPDPARWLGNGYFKKLGVPLLAHEEARKLMETRGADQLKAMQALLREKAHGTELALPRGFSSDTEEIRFSDSLLQLLYFGPAQSSGNIAVWLQREEIAFAGAIMQSDALLALTADSRLANWISAYDSLASLRPRQIVPGRGTLGNLARMDADTRTYLATLRALIDQAAQRGATKAEIISQAEKSKELTAFKRLQGYAELAPANVLQAVQERDGLR